MSDSIDFTGMSYEEVNEHAANILDRLSKGIKKDLLSTRNDALRKLKSELNKVGRDCQESRDLTQLMDSLIQSDDTSNDRFKELCVSEPRALKRALKQG